MNQEDQITLWELYKIGPTLPIQSISIGQWTETKGLIFTKIHKWYRRSNLLGHTFEITTLVEAPYITKIEFDSKTGKCNMEGSYADLLNLYAKTLNFTYTYVPPPDNAWGSLQNDGTWNGMVGLVQKEIVDFCKHFSFDLINQLSYLISQLPWDLGLYFLCQICFDFMVLSQLASSYEFETGVTLGQCCHL